MCEDYGHSPTITYGDIVYIRRCPHCERFVKPFEKILVNMDGEPKPDQKNAVCSKCGDVSMTFYDWV